jgi:hypothetical protein
MAKKKVAAKSKRICNTTVGRLIKKAIQFEGTDDLEDHVTGAAVQAIKSWGASHGVNLNDEDALSALVILFVTEKTDVFYGGDELPEILSAAQWKKHLAEMNKQCKLAK